MRLSLHDMEDEHKNLNVHQEVKETQKGAFKHINTTNTMEMFNSTIMKIVVTQKKANNDERTSPRGSHGFNKNSKSPRNGLFASSVHVNGVAMNSATGHNKGIIRVGQGVGIGKNNAAHGNRSR